ncbi:MAG: hypothetical protein HND48_11780 [Chloroflexi bacterium]|nr:hypothetical protein [Chloroflexota bacterium]
MGANTYGTTFNPVLWLAPYVNRGTIAGKVVDERGNFIDDADVSLVIAGATRDVTTTYVFRGSGSTVNPDPVWGENFVFSDVPIGRYEVVTTINGRRSADGGGTAGRDVVCRAEAPGGRSRHPVPLKGAILKDASGSRREHAVVTARVVTLDC